MRFLPSRVGSESGLKSAVLGRRCIRLAIALLLTTGLPRLSAAAPPSQRKDWVPVGRLDPSRVREASGIIKSRRHAGVFWTHGDSGNSPTLFAFTESGRLLAEVRIADAANSDWEDIAVDHAGNLYVGDIGNNKGFFPARYIYVVPEPDPRATPVGPVRASKRIKYRFPDKRFNAESLFVLGDRIYVISIGLQEGRPTVYRLNPVSKDECELEAVQKLPIVQARAADVSADGKRLVVCTSNSLWLTEIDEQGRMPPDAKPVRVRFPESAMEGCCFDGGDVVLVNEAGSIYRIQEADLRAGTTFARPQKKRK